MTTPSPGAIRDVTAHDACLFDEGGLASYFEYWAAPHIVERAGAVRDWPRVPPSAFDSLGSDDGVDTVLDLSANRQRGVKDTNVFRGLPPGSVAYGRVGPISEQASAGQSGPAAARRPLPVLGEMIAARQGGGSGSGSVT
ncbi:MAG: hypothetical protein ACR2JO_14020 [Mycobacteriales bacterium]